MEDIDKKNNNFDYRPIGFFDSGIGGLTVLDKVEKLLPQEDFIYFGDTKNMPYGEKTEAQLLDFADRIFKFFETKKVKAVVMACNTTSAVTYEKLKDNYSFKIYPIIQSVASILGEMDIKRFGIFATPATINSHVYKKEIEKYNPQVEIVERACPQWVKIVENCKEKDEQSEKIISNQLAEMLYNSPEKIILGCTHYPYLMDVLAKFTDKERFIDPAVYFAEFIKNDLAKSNMLREDFSGKREFYVTSNPKKFKSSAEIFYKLEKLPKGTSV